VILPSPIEEICRRNGAVIFFSNPDDAIRVTERQWLEQGRIHDTEDGRIRTDAEGERDDGNGREAGILRQHPQAVANILKKILKPAPFPHIATLLSQNQFVGESSLHGMVRFLW
jgi:hypothetical protein